MACHGASPHWCRNLRDLFQADADTFYEQFAAYDESDPNEGYKAAASAR